MVINNFLSKLNGCQNSFDYDNNNLDESTSNSSFTLPSNNVSCQQVLDKKSESFKTNYKTEMCRLIELNGSCKYGSGVINLINYLIIVCICSFKRRTKKKGYRQ